MAEETVGKAPEAVAAQGGEGAPARSSEGGPPRSGGRGPGGRPGGGPGGRGKFFRRKKVCKFCIEKIDDVNYKDVKLVGSFIAESGRIMPRRITGVCAPHQRRICDAIKKARNIGYNVFATKSPFWEQRLRSLSGDVSRPDR